jgi:hypothetical protein
VYNGSAAQVWALVILVVGFGGNFASEEYLYKFYFKIFGVSSARDCIY